MGAWSRAAGPATAGLSCGGTPGDGDAALARPPGVADRLERGKRRRCARIGFAGIGQRGEQFGRAEACALHGQRGEQALAHQVFPWAPGGRFEHGGGHDVVAVGIDEAGAGRGLGRAGEGQSGEREAAGARIGLLGREGVHFRVVVEPGKAAAMGEQVEQGQPAPLRMPPRRGRTGQQGPKARGQWFVPGQFARLDRAR
jgi:hypothetical protein